MSADVAAFSRGLDALDVALNREALPTDPLVLLVVRESLSVRVGQREPMRDRLLADGTLERSAAAFLRHLAPKGYVWAIIDWGDYVSTLLHPAPAVTRKAC